MSAVYERHVNSMAQLNAALPRIADALDVPVDVLTGPRGPKRVIRARFAAIVAMRDVLMPSVQRIGYTLGNRDHTTIIHGIDRGRELAETDADFAAMLASAKKAAAGA